MKQFKLGFRNASKQKKLETARRCALGVATLPEEKRPGAPIADLQESLAAMDQARARTQRLRNLLKASVTKEKILLTKVCDLTTRCAFSVSSAADGNEVLMRTAGLGIAASKQTPVGRPGEMTHFRGRAIEGSVELLWRSRWRRCWFHVELRKWEDSESAWVKWPETAARMRLKMTNLEPGVLYLFRVRANNACGQGPWSSTLVRIRAL